MELTITSLLLLPVGLGLLGFIEPCTIGAHVIFLSAQQKRHAGAKAAAVISFVGVRVLVMGAFGALLGVLGEPDRRPHAMGLQISIKLKSGRSEESKNVGTSD